MGGATEGAARKDRIDVRPPRERDVTEMTESESHQTLLARARRRTGRIAPERIVRHVLSVARGGDWAVRRDALEAVLRRCASVHTDDIQIVGLPRHHVLGLYAVRRRESRRSRLRTPCHRPMTSHVFCRA
jgi:hypothetical protein